ncbi:MAG TPA: Rv3654c family TadE-like protein [Mycobacteriales bacterium]|jgi:secretion/DNA translocation related TadE-like protein|nr:Rv3654c family TadE-like protein [Mycobacteriales bacterium]
MNRRLAAGDAGSATILLAAIGIAMILLAGTVAAAGSWLVGSVRADNAADQAVLAAAARVVLGQRPACQAAKEIAEANHARLSACRLDGLDAVVTVRGTSGLATFSPATWSSSTSRAGPAEGDP